jgi:hypothetical protein
MMDSLSFLLHDRVGGREFTATKRQRRAENNREGLAPPRNKISRSKFLGAFVLTTLLTISKNSLLRQDLIHFSLVSQFHIPSDNEVLPMLLPSKVQGSPIRSSLGVGVPSNETLASFTKNITPTDVNIMLFVESPRFCFLSLPVPYKYPIVSHVGDIPKM